MAYHQVTATSLTPSRPAPQAPQRRGTDNSSLYSSASTLVNSVYNPSFTLTPASPSGSSSYASKYSGIGGSPNRNSDVIMNSQIVRSGVVSIKEDGFASWMWKAKWMVLKEQTLSIHKSEVSAPVVLELKRLG